MNNLIDKIKEMRSAIDAKLELANHFLGEKETFDLGERLQHSIVEDQYILNDIMKQLDADQLKQLRF